MAVLFRFGNVRVERDVFNHQVRPSAITGTM